MERKLEALRRYRDIEHKRCRAQKRESIRSVFKVGGLVLLAIVCPPAAIALLD